MLNFRKITYNDREYINKYLTLYPFESCDYFFNTLFLWNHYYDYEFDIYKDILFLKCRFKSTLMFFIPIGNSLSLGLDILIEYTRLNDIKLILTVLEEKMVTKIEEIYPNKFKFKLINDNRNYIYDITNLKSLSGGIYKAKRNQINLFKKKYNYIEKIIDDTDTDNIIEFLDIWHKEKTLEGDFQVEKMAIIKALKYRKELDLVGMIITVNGSIVGFSMASIKGEMADIHFEKALYSYDGSYQMINYMFSNYLSDKVKYVNREEDMGILGIRKAKDSYNPLNIGYNYNGYYIPDLVFDIKKDDLSDDVYKLWNEVFLDGDYSKFFFENTNADIYTARIDNSLVGILSTITYYSSNLKILYLYALGTNAIYRGLGVMSELIEYIKNIAREEKYSAIALVPANENLFSFYEAAGFQITSFYNTYLKERKEVNYEINIGFNYEIMNKIYEDNAPLNHILRSSDIWNSIINDLYYDKGVSYYSGDAYALFKDGEILEYFGNIKILDEVMRINNLDSIKYRTKSNNDEKNGALFKLYEKVDSIYINMVFE